MELRAVAESAVDGVCRRRIAKRIDVRLERLQQRLRRLREASKDRLATDHDELVLPRDLCRGRHHVLEILGPQLGDLAQDPPPLRLAEQPRERRVLP